MGREERGTLRENLKSGLIGRFSGITKNGKLTAGNLFSIIGHEFCTFQRIVFSIIVFFAAKYYKNVVKIGCSLHNNTDFPAKNPARISAKIPARTFARK